MFQPRELTPEQKRWVVPMLWATAAFSALIWFRRWELANLLMAVGNASLALHLCRFPIRTPAAIFRRVRTGEQDAGLEATLYVVTLVGLLGSFLARVMR